MRRQFDPREHQKAVDHRNKVAAATGAPDSSSRHNATGLAGGQLNARVQAAEECNREFCPLLHFPCMLLPGELPPPPGPRRQLPGGFPAGDHRKAACCAASR